MRAIVRRIIGFAAACTALGAAWAQNPTLTSCDPAYIQRGTAAQLVLRGEALGAPLDLVFDRPGLASMGLQPGRRGAVEAAVTAAADAPLGPHTVRVRTARSVSSAALVFVGALPAEAEVEENNNSLAEAPLHDLGVALLGVITEEDVDHFAFDVPAGATLRAALVGVALGHRTFDPLLELFDTSGATLARVDDTAASRRDPWLEYTAPGDTRCVLRVRDAAHGGARDARYVLTVDAGPQPIRAAPLAQESAAPHMLWARSGPLGTTMTGAADWVNSGGWRPSGVRRWWPEGSLLPLALRDSALVAVRETQGGAEAQVVTLPGAFEGVLSNPGEVDRFTVELAKDDVVEVALFARRLGSKLDGELRTRGAAQDDSVGADPVLRYTARATGSVTFEVHDHLGRGGPEYFYRAEVTRPTPRAQMTITGPRKELAIARGARNFVAFGVELSELEGALLARLGELPAGVTAAYPAEPLYTNQAVALLEASADAPLGHGLTAARVDVHSESGVVTGVLHDQIVLSEGPNNTLLAAETVDRLALAVVEAAPFDVTLAVPRVPLARASRVDVAVAVTRAEGHTGALTVGLASLPPGVRAPSPRALKPEETEAVFTLEVASDARLGPGALLAFCEGPVDGVTVRVATPFQPVRVTEALLALTPKPGSVSLAGDGALAVAVARATTAAEFGYVEPTVTLRLAGLPRGLQGFDTALRLDSADVAIPLSATAAAPVGRHRGVVVEAHIDLAGSASATAPPAAPARRLVQTLGGAEVRVRDTAVLAAASAPTPQASRLAELRAEHAAVRASEGEPPLLASPRAAPAALQTSALELDWPDTVPSFRNDVLPILTARGCNGGACHGASQGQDGFHLSLYGFDAAGDRERIVMQRAARRIDPAFPLESLLLTKATGTVPHTGGARLSPGDEDYTALAAWIRAGAPDDPPDLPNVVGLILAPEALVLRGAGAEARLSVRARYSDGSERDVTRLALLRTDDPSTATVDAAGRVRSGVPGRASVSASFATETALVSVVVLPEGEAIAWSDPADATDVPESWIDAALAVEHRRLELNPAPLVDDERYLRRVTLDLIGRAPTVAERTQFLADPAPSFAKRRALAAELVQRREFTDLWVMRFAELLRIRGGDDVPPKVAEAWFAELSDAMHRGERLDRVVRRVLTAEGLTTEAPAAAYFLLQRDPKVQAEDFAQAFLGVRISCAQCHNHPFDRWTQDDHTGLVAFFAELRTKRGEDPNEWAVRDQRGRETRHPLTNQPVPPRPLGEAPLDLAGRTRRVALADWLLEPSNPWFARNMANRVWAAYLGRGVIEPVDDVRISNPPLSEALLTALAEHLAESGFDLADLALEVVTSRAYQRESAHATPTSVRNFAAFGVRRLRAEVLADTLAAVTESPDDHPRLPRGASATQIADGSVGGIFLRTFGRAPRATVCACEASDAPSLSQALHLVNGTTVHEKVTRGPVVQRLLTTTEDDPAIIDALYLQALSRAASDDERTLALGLLDGQDEDARRAILEDLFFALLTSNEFLFQQ